MQLETEQLKAEVGKEKKLRERSDGFARELEAEVDSLRRQNSQHRRSSSMGTGADAEKLAAAMAMAESSEAEAKRLRVELDQTREESEDYTSSLSEDIRRLQSTIADLEIDKNRLEEESFWMKNQQSKIEADIRADAMSQAEEVREEKQRLQEEMTLLRSELTEMRSRYGDNFSADGSVVQMSNSTASGDRNGTVMMQRWENQLQEMVRWADDEMDAKERLQSLTARILEELDILRVQSSARRGSPGAANMTSSGNSSWKQRRLLKMEKLEVSNLQLSLQAEIQAKEKMSEELNRTKARLAEVEAKLHMAESNNVNMEKRLEEMKDDQLKSTSYYISDTVSSYLKIDPQNDRSLQDDNTTGEDSEVTSTSSILTGNDSSPKHALPLPPRTSLPSSRGSLPNQSMMESPVASQHRFTEWSFAEPHKCQHCTSLMMGLQRQGVVCQECQFTCHRSCINEASPFCPIPPGQSKTQFAINPMRGTGTVIEGLIKIPKPGGIRRGWIRQFLVLCDFKLCFHDLSSEKGAPLVTISRIIDMRSPGFVVESVQDSDVIHANRRDIPSILKVSTTEIVTGNPQCQFLLADSQQDKIRWLRCMEELLKIMSRHRIVGNRAIEPKEVFDGSFPLLKSCLCGEILDADRVILGTEDGLHVVDMRDNSIIRIGEKKVVYKLSLHESLQLVVIIQSKQRQLKLLMRGSLEGMDLEPIKVPDCKNCSLMSSQQIGGRTFLCVASRRTVHTFELNRTRQRHQKLRDIQCPDNVQCLQIMSDGRICVGSSSYFALYSITPSSDSPVQILLQADSVDLDPSLSHFRRAAMEAMWAVAVSSDEFLLVFETCGIYINRDRSRSRPIELLWPDRPLAFSYSAPYVCCYSENCIFVYDVNEAAWIQTVSIKQARPLLPDGTLVVSHNAVESASRLLYLKLKNDEGDRLHLPDISPGRRFKAKRKFSLRSIKDDSQTVSRASRLISGPSDFKHVSHMGPETSTRFIDLPSSGSESERVKRVKSIIEEQRQSSVTSISFESSSRTPPHLDRHHSQGEPPQKNVHRQQAMTLPRLSSGASTASPQSQPVVVRSGSPNGRPNGARPVSIQSWEQPPTSPSLHDQIMSQFKSQWQENGSSYRDEESFVQEMSSMSFSDVNTTDCIVEHDEVDS